jgi:acetyltransferase-like isoleucine patch superfamily enzyme
VSEKRQFKILGKCEVHSTARISDGAIVGKRFRPFLDGTREARSKTTVRSHVYIGHYSIIGTGSTIGSNVVIDDFVTIESRVLIGEKTLIIYRAHICNDARIGPDCVIGGFVGERAIVGSNCRIFGKLVHLQREPHKGWDDDTVCEPAPTIRDGAFIGFDAIVAGGVTIGNKAYVCAGALVTKDVPPRYVAAGRNGIVHFSKWKGALKDSKFFTKK